MNKHKRDHMDTVNVVMFVLNSVTFSSRSGTLPNDNFMWE